MRLHVVVINAVDNLLAWMDITNTKVLNGQIEQRSEQTSIFAGTRPSLVSIFDTC